MRRGSPRRPSSREPARGYTFVALLALVAILSIGLSVAGPAWSSAERRHRERELLRIGALYAQALAAYHEGSPGTLKTFPRTLGELALDPRFVGVRRHLRTLYPDPLDPSRPWGLVKDIDGRITGVYSQSEDAPIAEGSVAIGALVLPPARRYADWKFIALLPT